jgi:hypothetical protein
MISLLGSVRCSMAVDRTTARGGALYEPQQRLGSRQDAAAQHLLPFDVWHMHSHSISAARQGSARVTPMMMSDEFFLSARDKLGAHRSRRNTGCGTGSRCEPL